MNNNKILEFRAKVKIRSIPKGHIVELYGIDSYKSKTDTYINVHADKKNFLANNDWEIYKVLRLEDNVIFTVGDVVTTKDSFKCQFIIASMKINSNTIIVENEGSMISCCISELCQPIVYNKNLYPIF